MMRNTIWLRLALMSVAAAMVTPVLMGQTQGGQQGKGEEKGARKGQVKQDENKKE